MTWVMGRPCTEAYAATDDATGRLDPGKCIRSPGFWPATEGSLGADARRREETVVTSGVPAGSGSPRVPPENLIRACNGRVLNSECAD